mmetsp:Transcript_43738/g.114038  ORF Transcript_43738/g.114038 Transcript_43738/m.114038 type:complete len:272 (+) Transcript_43738:1105-1920(+)
MKYRVRKYACKAPFMCNLQHMLKSEQIKKGKAIEKTSATHTCIFSTSGCFSKAVDQVWSSALKQKRSNWTRASKEGKRVGAAYSSQRANKPVRFLLVRRHGRDTPWVCQYKPCHSLWMPLAVVCCHVATEAVTNNRKFFDAHLLYPLLEVVYQNLFRLFWCSAAFVGDHATPRKPHHVERVYFCVGRYSVIRAHKSANTTSVSMQHHHHLFFFALVSHYEGVQVFTRLHLNHFLPMRTLHSFQNLYFRLVVLGVTCWQPPALPQCDRQGTE